MYIFTAFLILGQSITQKCEQTYILTKTVYLSVVNICNKYTPGLRTLVRILSLSKKLLTALLRPYPWKQKDLLCLTCLGKWPKAMMTNN